MVCIFEIMYVITIYHYIVANKVLQNKKKRNYNLSELFVIFINMKHAHHLLLYIEYYNLNGFALRTENCKGLDNLSESLYHLMKCCSSVWCQRSNLYDFLLQSWCKRSNICAFMIKSWCKRSKLCAFLIKSWCKMSNICAFMIKSWCKKSNLCALLFKGWCQTQIYILCAAVGIDFKGKSLKNIRA